MRTLTALAVVLGSVAAACSVSTIPEPVPAADPSSLYASHHDGKEFFNPWNRFDPSFKRILRMTMERKPFEESVGEIPVFENDGLALAGEQDGAKITWVGHATAVIHEGDDVVITDPNFSERMVVFRRKTPPGIPIETVPADAMAVISHNHNDHLDVGTVERLPDTVAWFVPLGMAEWFRERGRHNVVELDWWQSAKHGRWTMTCLPSQHWSRRVGQGFNEVLWCSWLMESGTTRYYFAGDTGYFHGFAEFARRFAPIDVALMPIGAYEPRWFMSYQHVSPGEAYQAFRELGARHMVPLHWGTFDLALEALDQPPKDLMQAVEDVAGDHDAVHVLGIGEGWQVPPRSEEAGMARPAGRGGQRAHGPDVTEPESALLPKHAGDER